LIRPSSLSSPPCDPSISLSLTPLQFLSGVFRSNSLRSHAAAADLLSGRKIPHLSSLSPPRPRRFAMADEQVAKPA
uniref:Uncharacterized protein n=1 Tax=Aegilops tauschii subsp. strangulata TaxID=200361 RepID=A0A453LTR6_AEGTS